MSSLPFLPDLITRILPIPVLLAAVAGVAAAVIAIYRRERSLVPPAVGRALTGLRLAAALLVVTLLAGPVRISREEVTVPGEVLIAVDCSRSFSLADPHRPLSQIEAEAAALGADPAGIRAASRRDLAASALANPWFDDLRRRFKASLHGFAGDLRPLDPGSGSGGPVEIPPADGPTTDILGPIGKEALRREAGRLSGIILITDGNHHAEGDPRDAARVLASQGIRVVAVGVGPLEKLPDVALKAIDATGKVFAGDEIKAEVTLGAAGLPAQELKITVVDGANPVKTFVAEIPAGESAIQLPVSFPAGSPGRKKFTFSFSPVPGEVTAANNARDAWIEVLSEKARVLLLDAAPRWEERYLRAAWTRDGQVQLASFLLTPPPERRLPAGFPRARDELFQHDVVVVGDVDPSAFSREEVAGLRDFVEARGGTLIAIAGERAMPYRWAATPLEELLPVELLEPAPRRGLSPDSGQDGIAISLTSAGEPSEITRLVPGRVRNLELWELLPRPKWITASAGPRTGAETLAVARVAGKEEILFAVRPHGAGKVFYCGSDSTWRWRFRFGEELFKRFWGQVIRWAVSSRFSAEDDHVRVGTDSLVYDAAAKVTVEALIQKAPGVPLEDEAVDAVISREADSGEARLRLSPIPRSGGRYRGSASIDDLGLAPPVAAAAAPPDAGRTVEHRVRIDAPAIPGYSTRKDRAAALFVVHPAPDPELEDLACDRSLLEEIASITGGRFLPLSRFTEAAAGLPDRSHVEEKITETGPMDFPLLLAALLFGLLAAEWVMRKRWDLY